jgi:hypothetical protein
VRRFTFRLERVLRLKQQREKLAALAQAQAASAVERARITVAALQAELKQNALAIGAKVGQVTPSGVWLAKYEHSARLAAVLETAEQQLQHAAVCLREASVARSRFATEVEVLIAQKQRQRREHRHETMAKQQIDLNEIAMRRWQAAQHSERRAEPPRTHEGAS